MSELREEVLIVGGSLTGLTFALACAKWGVPARVLERATVEPREGGALGVNRNHLARVIGVNPRVNGQVSALPVVVCQQEVTSWYLLHRWLRNQALQCEEITLIEGFDVCRVTQHDGVATAVGRDGRRMNAWLIVGADGYRSIVRAATYAGYMLWRGLVDESDLPLNTRWPRNDQGGGFISSVGYRLIAYAVPGRDGSTQPGERQISFAWYDPTRAALLYEQQCISRSQTVLAPLLPENISSQLRGELLDQTREIWPDPWRSAVVYALEKSAVFATPVAEYYPNRLCRGRLAVIGDAAHVVSPITGKGFAAGLLDAETLAKSLKDCRVRNEPDASWALQRYEDERLDEARELAVTSKIWSREYLGEFYRRNALSRARHRKDDAQE